MNKLFLLSLTILSLSSCIKEKNEFLPIIEPEPQIILSRDTITTGEKWGLKIGDSSEKVYTSIQALNTENKISYYAIVGNVFTDVNDLKTRIPLYKAMILDEKIGTSSSIQIQFAENKIKSIWVGSKEVTKWPNNVSSNATLSIDDNIADIYEKLVNIKKIDAYDKKLERISLFQKDAAKAYDEQMAISNQWYFTTPLNDQKFHYIQLNFLNGKLVSLYVEHRKVS